MIGLKNISKVYNDGFGNKVVLFKNISFSIEQSMITAIVAPYGSGKTTLLKIISGLEKESSGEIIKSGKVIFLASEPSSFPWLSVKENIQFGLKKNNNESIDELIKQVGLEGYENHYPNNNSIGFRFRIALARSLAIRPNLICIDESFSKMDDNTKIELYQLIRKINNETNVTFLIATTNLSEAVFLSDTILLMSNKPAEIFLTLNNPLPQNGDHSTIGSDEFNSFIRELETSFRKVLPDKLLHITI